MKKTYHNYTFSDDKSIVCSLQEAVDYCKKNGVSVVKGYLLDDRPIQKLHNKRIRDNNYEGWNYGLGEYVKSKAHFNQIIKDRNLTVLGNDRLPAWKDREIDDGITLETIKEANAMGGEIGTVAADALINKTYEMPGVSDS